MFSDMTGYSRMMGKDEEGTLVLVEEMTALMTRLVGEYRGNVLKFIGDAVLATFDSAYDAVFCAVAVQQLLAERNRAKPPEEKILIRIGIHTGDIVLKEGDVFGDGVNIAARLEPQAKPGGICISQAVYDAVKARPNIRIVSLGRRKLKNIEEAVPIYHVLTDTEGRIPSQFTARLESFAHRIPRWTLAILALFAAAWWGWRPVQRFHPSRLTTFTIAMTRFSGASAQAQDESKIARDLIRQKLNDFLGRDSYINILSDGIKKIPRTHAEAKDLGSDVGADIVIWGGAIEFRNEIEIKPYITALDPSWDYPAIEPKAFRAKIDDPNELTLLDAEAHEMGNLVLLAAARFYQHKGVYDRALSLLQRISPPNADSLITQGWIHFALKQRDLMKEDFTRAVALDPKALYPRQMLALAHFFLGDSDRAIRELQAIQMENPQNAKTYQLFGAIYLAQGKLDKAIEYAKKALERDPQDSYIYADLGKIYCRQGKYDQAANIYWSWVRMYPKDMRANLLYYLMARRSGQASKADSYLHEFLKRLPPSRMALDSSWPAAVVYFFAGKTSEAELLKSIEGTNLSARPRREMEGYFYLGMAHLLNDKEPNHIQRARDYFEKCVSTELQYNEYFLAQSELSRIDQQAKQ